MRGLLRILVVFFVITAVLSIVRGFFASSTPRTRPNVPRPPQPNRLVKDPVCGTYVVAGSAIREGEEFFCSDECRSRFLAG
jgi:hypothetical protein